jgi:nucleotide-binding universal stress UspA family protein
MYKHILIPTDGSEVAEKAIEAGIEFAREANAKITWFTAVPEYQLPTPSEITTKRFVSPDEHEKRSRALAEALLAGPVRRSKAAGVACETDYSQNDRPYQGIIDAAKRHGCDLIFMASHGRKLIGSIFLGSETRDVLTHSTIPTLVYR